MHPYFFSYLIWFVYTWRKIHSICHLNQHSTRLNNIVNWKNGDVKRNWKLNEFEHFWVVFTCKLIWSPIKMTISLNNDKFCAIFVLSLSPVLFRSVLVNAWHRCTYNNRRINLYQFKVISKNQCTKRAIKKKYRMYAMVSKVK